MKPYQFSFEAIGTHWVIDILVHTLQTTSEQEILSTHVRKTIETFDVVFSRFRSDSLVTTMASNPGEYTLPSYAQPMMALYKRMYELTKGHMTPLVGNLLSDMGYDAIYSFQPTSLTKPLSWDDAIVYDPPLLTIKQPVLLDFGAAGKGYCIDLVGKVLEKYGVTGFCIDAGGDMLHKSPDQTSLRVGLEDPRDATRVLGVIRLKNQSICGSAGNRRKWGNMHHIVNPYTLTSVNNILAVWVIAKTGMLADACTTALFFIEPAVLQKEFAFEYLILYPDFTMKMSDNISAELYYTK